MGVSGSGKTTIGRILSQKMGIPFFDGDDFHSAENKEKMKAGIPLTDADRQGWLQLLNKLAAAESVKGGAIIACSALKEKYRKLLSENLDNLAWVFLKGSYELISQRMKYRTGHFMPPVLLQSQFDTLEAPQGAITVEIDKDPEEITDDIIRLLKEKAADK
jgi:gluconokinase